MRLTTPSHRDRAQVSWSNADLSGTPESDQNMPCGTLYAALCGTADSSNVITSLLDLPPSSPPPPMQPDAELDDLTPKVMRVIASGGFRSGRRLEEQTNNPLIECTDGGDSDMKNTPCIADGEERPVSCLTALIT